MTYIKCNDCGKIYDANLEACPQCGCPTEQQPKMPTVDENTPVNVTEILSISEDKFEETKDIRIICRKILSTSIDNLCQTLDIDTPEIILEYHVEKGIGQLRIVYYENELLEKIESIQNRDLWDKYGSPCKRMIINIDDRENIRLDLEKGGLYLAFFPIEKDLFLKCCNAKKLEFKITKENGEYISVKGYYDFDSETGAEIDVNGDVVPENDLILNFQALYNYIIDSSMFTDALRKRQMYNDLIKRKNAEIEEEVKKEVEDEADDNYSKGVGWLLVGILSVVIGLVLFISKVSDPGPTFIIGVVLFVFGILPLVYGIAKMQGKSNEEAWEAVKQAGEAMGH